jgi:hypothetical protein
VILNGIEMVRVAKKMSRKLAPKIMEGKGFFTPEEISRLLYKECGYINLTRCDTIALMRVLEARGIKVKRSWESGSVAYAIE